MKKIQFPRITYTRKNAFCKNSIFATFPDKFTRIKAMLDKNDKSNRKSNFKSKKFLTFVMGDEKRS